MRRIIVIALQISGDIAACLLDMTGMVLDGGGDLREKECILIPLVPGQILGSLHGSIWVACIQLVMAAIADVAAKRLEYNVVFRSIYSGTGHQIFFRHLFNGYRAGRRLYFGGPA